MSEVRAKKDVAIIGAGPVGIFSVFALGMAGLATCVIEGMDKIGGQCSSLYPEKPIYDIPALPTVTGGGLIERLEEQAKPFKPEYILSRRVMSLTKNVDDDFELMLQTQEKVVARALLIAAGAGAFVPNRPPLPNIDRFEGKTVLYFIEESAQFSGKDVVIAGGGDSALDWALILKDIAKSVTLIHRRATFRAHESTQAALQEAIQNGTIVVKAPFVLHGVEGEGNELSQVIIKDFDDKQESLKADYLLPFFGIATDLGPLATWGIDLEGKRIIVNPTTMQTSLKGVYAVGDVNTYQNKRKLIAVGFSEAMYAAQDIYKYVYPDKVFRSAYSTAVGVPGVE